MSMILHIPPTPDQTPGLPLSADTVALREIEQEVARRVGPFFLRVVRNARDDGPPGASSSFTTLAVPAIRSTIDLGGLEDMFVLRRGRLRDGTLLPTTAPEGERPWSPDDRVRAVKSYRPQEGLIEVDWPYDIVPYDEEEVELHHLDPEQELRPAVLAGLRRCYVVHRLAVDGTVAGAADTIDLTERAPWLLSRDEVYGVSLAGGAPAVGWRVEPYGGGLYLVLREYSHGTSYVVNRRPTTAMVWPATPSAMPDGTAILGTWDRVAHKTWDELAGGHTWDSILFPYNDGANGNGEDGVVDWAVRAGTVNEPWDDEDRFPIPVDYAAAAGHIECWRSARPRLAAVAQLGLWADQKEAAAEFTRVSTKHFDPPRHDSPLSLSHRRWPDNPLSNAP